MAGTYPIAPGFVLKQSTKLEMPARDKEFSLLGPFISYKEQCYIKLAEENPQCILNYFSILIL
jgi:hypothetical protein